MGSCDDVWHFNRRKNALEWLAGGGRGNQNDDTWPILVDLWDFQLAAGFLYSTLSNGGDSVYKRWSW